MSQEYDKKPEDTPPFRQWQFYRLQDSLITLGRTGEKPSNNVAITLLLGLDIHYYLDYQESLVQSKKFGLLPSFFARRSAEQEFRKKRFIHHRHMLESLVKQNKNDLKLYVSQERKRYSSLINSCLDFRKNLVLESNTDEMLLQETNRMIGISMGFIQLCRWIENHDMRGSYAEDIKNVIFIEYSYKQNRFVDR